MTRSGKQWFVVRTKTGGEVTASIAVAGKGFDVFLPVQLVTRMRNRKREEVSRPLFPRYLFVAFDPARDTHGEINWCRGVANRGLMVTADGRPIPVKDSIIAQIRGEEAARMAKAGQVTTGYSPGETFQIQRGHATITAVYMGEEKGKVMCIVEFMGRGHIQTLDFSEVPQKLLDSHAA